MNEEPTKDLATRAFYKRVLDEFAGVRKEQAATRQDIVAMREDIAEIRSQQAAMAGNIVALDQRVTSLNQQFTSVEERLLSLEDKVDSRLKETRPIWEAVQQQLRKLDKKFDLVIKDLFELRSDVATHDKRIGDLEQKILAS
jgi:chromosome segregation ATPase